MTSTASTFPIGVPRPPPYAVVFGPRANCTLNICPLQYSVYGYRPSLAASYTFITLNALAGLVHAYLGFRWKQWWFMGCMLVGTVNAVIGYVGRVMMYWNPFNFSAFMLQIICITTGPVYYCAAIYITLALSIQNLNPHISRLPPRLLYTIFIPADIVSLVLQAAGGALSTSSSGSSQVGIDLALAGMSFQVFTMVVFCGLLGDYLFRYYRRQEGGAVVVVGGGVKSGRGLGLFFGFIGLALVLTLVRCAYRLAELHEGYSGHLVKEEGLFIGLEGVMVLMAVYCLMIGHPGFVFKKGAKEYELGGQSEQELRELK
ncbi:RTA1 like protein-domain-containing protein [Staphylotrichum tortipilum]|uniref:RTA1 like protein-domain-containing protein n=1 Tax=Staphylotrichum tortipilum TaxID=2831512 RepID=A0AAN6MJ36_9PEZI|nr:RTA1 like protein-domain-containing protein [Staphylotrichum longicolle]